MLIDRFAEAGVRMGAGCPASMLDAFEARTGRVLTADLRAFLGAANGVEWDDGFCFWPVEAFAPFDPVAERYAPGCPRPSDAGSYFVFCDYLHWSWGYAIRMDRPEDVEGGNEVVPIGMNEMFAVAGSFAEFVELYLAGSDRLYPPG
ncbi:MAG TPA: SMI1/KNR4 family protein [Longimicrobium sp.]|nr:SMI1/KNR4 family protein [Longimicrobium sp.]